MKIITTLLTLLTVTYQLKAQNPKDADYLAIKQKTNEWIALWSPGATTATFDGIENIFATEKEGLLVVDGFEGSVVVINSIEEYKTKWLPLLNESFSFYKIKPKGELSISVDENMATVTFIWESDGAKLKDGSSIKLSQYATHIWKKLDGQWKLVHEHLTNIDASNSSKTDQETISRLSKEWIEDGFSPKNDTQNYTYEKYLKPWYATDWPVVLHDNNDTQMRISQDVEEYAKIWEEAFKATDFIDNELTEMLQVEVQGDLAFSSFTADAIVAPKGSEQKVRMPVFYSIGWKKTKNGWKIIHEHGSVLTKDSAVKAAND